MNNFWRLSFGLLITLMMLDTAAGQLIDQIVVANRASGNISVIDVGTHNVATHPLPTPMGGQAPEPMYVVYMPTNHQVYVGDRANNQVVAFDASTYSVVDSVPAGAGVFHMWGDPSDNQIWVVNDVDNSVTVIDTTTDTALTTFSTPADLNAAGGRPHDVILDPSGPAGYVTMVGLAATQTNDAVVKFEHQGGTSIAEVGRADTGADPHLSLTAANDQLYLPTQGADQVRVLARSDLSFNTDIPVANAHGVSISADGMRMYVTNISDGGTGGLVTIDLITNMVVDTDDTPAATPHNIALSPDNSELFITHSGATSDLVSVFDLSNPSNPSLLTTVTVGGNNPFGLAAVKAIPEPSSLILFALAGLVGFSRVRV